MKMREKKYQERGGEMRILIREDKTMAIRLTVTVTGCLGKA